MPYTLWRGATQVGYSVGEVTLEHPGMLSARIEMLATYTLPAGFSQWISTGVEPRTIDLIIDSPERATRTEPPEPCPVHVDADPQCFRLREYTGPVEHPTAETAFVLRDPDGHPLDMAMLWVSDNRSMFSEFAHVHEPFNLGFRLNAISTDALAVEPQSI